MMDFNDLLKSAFERKPRKEQPTREQLMADINASRDEINTECRLKEEDIQAVINKARRARAEGNREKFRFAERELRVKYAQMKYMDTLRFQMETMYEEVKMAQSMNAFAETAQKMNVVLKEYSRNGADVRKVTEVFVRELKPLQKEYQALNVDEITSKLMAAGERTMNVSSVPDDEIEALLNGADIQDVLYSAEDTDPASA